MFLTVCLFVFSNWVTIKRNKGVIFNQKNAGLFK